MASMLLTAAPKVRSEPGCMVHWPASAPPKSSQRICMPPPLWRPNGNRIERAWPSKNVFGSSVTLPLWSTRSLPWSRSPFM